MLLQAFLYLAAAVLDLVGPAEAVGHFAELGVAAGRGWQVATAGGVILALSSTAIIVQTLQEKN